MVQSVSIVSVYQKILKGHMDDFVPIPSMTRITLVETL